MKENPQFLRTDKAIRQALITLLKTKSFEKITVQDILDETPVTRSTFYKHYHDKYEIVEKMQDDFFETHTILSRELHSNPSTAFITLQKMLRENREILETLLHVRTEHVDLRQSLAKYAESYYLQHNNNPNRYIEAEVFAQMITAFEISSHIKENPTLEFMYDTVISAMFMALRISEDEELRTLIKSRATHELPIPTSL